MTGPRPHDNELVDEGGRRLARRRLPEGVEGLAALHALVADHLAEDAEPDQVPWIFLGDFGRDGTVVRIPGHGHGHNCAYGPRPE
jgi:hypothetical protein